MFWLTIAFICLLAELTMPTSIFIIPSASAFISYAICILSSNSFSMTLQICLFVMLNFLIIYFIQRRTPHVQHVNICLGKYYVGNKVVLDHKIKHHTFKVEIGGSYWTLYAEDVEVGEEVLIIKYTDGIFIGKKIQNTH